MSCTPIMRTLAAALATALVCLCAVPAAAQVEDLTEEQIEELKLWLSKANRLYDEGDYAGALKRYREGLDIAELPEIHYRMATCFEKLDRYAEAVNAYERFLELDPEAKERGRVEKDIERLRAKLDGQGTGQLEVNSDPEGATISLMENGVARALGTTPATAEVPSGTVSVRVELEGHEPHEQVVDVPSGGTAVITVVLAAVGQDPKEEPTVTPKPEPKPVDPVEPVVEEGFNYGLWGWVTTGVGLALGATSVVLFFRTNSTIADYNGYDRRAADASRDELEGLADDVATFKTATVWTGIGAGVVGVAGITLLLLDPGAEEPEPVGLFVTPDGGAVVTYELRW